MNAPQRASMASLMAQGDSIVHKINGGTGEPLNVFKVETCPFCQGSGVGWVEDETGYACQQCKGTGQKREESPKPTLGAVTVDDEGWWS